MLAGRSLKTGAGELARMTISPFIRCERVAHQRADAVGQAEEPQDRQDRNRQPDDRQQRARRPRDQVSPGEQKHETALSGMRHGDQGVLQANGRPRPMRERADGPAGISTLTAERTVIAARSASSKG